MRKRVKNRVAKIFFFCCFIYFFIGFPEKSFLTAPDTNIVYYVKKKISLKILSKYRGRRTTVEQYSSSQVSHNSVSISSVHFARFVDSETRIVKGIVDGGRENIGVDPPQVVSERFKNSRLFKRIVPAR